MFGLGNTWAGSEIDEVKDLSNGLWAIVDNYGGGVGECEVGYSEGG